MRRLVEITRGRVGIKSLEGDIIINLEEEENFQ